MATITIIKCDRCGQSNEKHSLLFRGVSLDRAQHDICETCYRTISGVIANDIHEGLLLGAKAVEDLQENIGDDRMAALCGCSGSHLSDTLREVEKHMDEGPTP